MREDGEKDFIAIFIFEEVVGGRIRLFFSWPKRTKLEQESHFHMEEKTSLTIRAVQGQKDLIQEGCRLVSLHWKSFKQRVWVTTS